MPVVPVCDRGICLVRPGVCAQPSNSFVCLLNHTCMSVYYCDNSGMVERLPGYEGVTNIESVGVHRCESKLR